MVGYICGLWKSTIDKKGRMNIEAGVGCLQHSHRGIRKILLLLLQLNCSFELQPYKVQAATWAI